MTDLAADGATIDKSVTTTSANGLSTSVRVDSTGDGTFDNTTNAITTLNADGSRPRR